MKDRLFELLLKYSINGELTYFFALHLAKEYLGINHKAFRRLMVELHRDGLWEWKDGKIRLLAMKPEAELEKGGRGWARKSTLH